MGRRRRSLGTLIDTDSMYKAHLCLSIIFLLNKYRFTPWPERNLIPYQIVTLVTTVVVSDENQVVNNKTVTSVTSTQYLLNSATCRIT